MHNRLSLLGDGEMVAAATNAQETVEELLDVWDVDI
jgi:hypothetical protein